jgi:hypothetical protein
MSVSLSRARARGAGTRAAVLPRAALVLVAAAQAEVAIWGELSPRSFWTSFPGFGHHWVMGMGAYDEHLVRDYAATELGLAVLLACAAVWFGRHVVLIAGAAFLAATLPHFIYHLTTTAMLSVSDDAASLGAFVLEMALVALAMAAAGSTRPARSDT